MKVDKKSYLMLTLSVFLIISCYGAPKMTNVSVQVNTKGLQVTFNVAPNMDLTYDIHCDKTCKA